MNPIIMIGTQRSGSNLLRLMLNQLPEIASPHPPHIIQRLAPLVEGLDTSEPNVFSYMVDAVCQLVELNPVQWDGVNMDRDEIAKRCRDNSLMAVFGAVYDIFAEAQGAETWCCKSLAMLNYADEIERYFGKPKYLYLYRDGRDVALSFRKAVVGEKHFYNIGNEWATTQRKALKLKDRIEEDRFLSVSYEQLTGEAEETSKRLCEFLGVPHRRSMLDFHKSNEAQRAATSSSLWGNVTNPVLKNNTRKFLKEASELDIRIFESVAGDVLDSLGYDRVYTKKGEEIKFAESDISAFNRENVWVKDLREKSMDAEDYKRRQIQRVFLNSAKNTFSELRTKKAAA